MGPDWAGSASIVVCLLAAVASSLTAATGRAAPARRLLGLAAIAAIVGCGVLVRALVDLDLSVAYVSEVTSHSTSSVYRVAGLWGGMQGSLLLWLAVIAIATWVGACAVRRRMAAMEAPVIVVSSALVAAFASIVLFTVSPFETVSLPPTDGAGLVPILEHPAMLYHPPLLYSGIAAFAAPFALTIAAVWRGEVDDDWVRLCRSMLLVAWALLGLGLLAGAHWSYAELDWGGYWAWDPVENAGLVPWLGATLALHVLVWARRFGPRTSDAGFVLGAFGLAVLGGALSRSGAVNSVHAFAEGSQVGVAFAVVVALLAGVSLVALWRGRRSTKSRPFGLVLVGNFLLALMVVVVVIGTAYPLVRGGGAALRGRYFTTMLTPLAVALVVVLIADGVRRRARPSWGSVLAHVGVLMVLASAVATTFSEAAVGPLAPGEAMTVGGARVELVSWTAHPLHDTAFRVEAHLRVDGRADHAALDVYPERRASLPHVEKHSTLVRDVKVAVVRAIDEERLLIELRVVPFARGLWIGGLLVVAGGVVALVTRWRRPPVADHGTGAAQVEASTPGRVVAR